MKITRAHFASILLATLFASVTGISWHSAAQTLFERGTLSIQTAAGEKHDFTIEIAASSEARRRGLMFRESLAPGHGMLFDYGRAARASMWMKNTLIPLDMLFISPNGKIESIAKRTIPGSLEAISSKGPVRGVLELNAGTADRLGISVGDTIAHALFGTAE